MKKTVLILALAIGATGAFAQDFKPAAGSKTLEFGFTPQAISMSGIQFRMFKTETMAYRMGLYIGFMSGSEVDAQATAAVGTTAARNELKTKTSSFEIDLTPGVEMHFAGTDQLSPYWGGILDIGYKMSSEVVDGEAETDPTKASNVQTTTTKNEDGFLRFGAGLVFGTDYYFAKKFYLGVEGGFGFAFTKNSDIHTEDTYTHPSGYVAPADQVQGSSFQLAPTVKGKLRLGWNF